jgi:hypothetical protein
MFFCTTPRGAGADLSRVHVLYETVASTDVNASERTINLKSDLAELSRTLAWIGDVALVIIDPINAYKGGMDSHKNTEIRASSISAAI